MVVGKLAGLCTVVLVMPVVDGPICAGSWYFPRVSV